MALLTSRSFQHIVSISITSRIIVILLQYITNIILEDHNADAYRSPYYIALTHNETYQSELSDSHRYLYKSIEGFTKWDAQYFLEIANVGYVKEQHLAFLPLFPVSIALIRQLLFDHSRLNLDFILKKPRITTSDQSISGFELENYIKSALIGCALNNFLLFPLACLSLFVLTKLVRRNDEIYAKNVVWWFCFNPASIFFSACYSESLFSALTFTAMMVMEYKAESYLANHRNNFRDGNKNQSNFMPLNHLNRLLSICLPSLVLLALSSATRSNALVTTGFLIYQFILKYEPLIRLDRSHWSMVSYATTFLECIQDMLVLFMSSVIAASGYITFQIYSYIKFCTEKNRAPKGNLNLRAEWCDNWLPHPYSQVQGKYWNVGLFNYYQARQLPNFLLATPMSYLVLIGSLKRCKEIVSKACEKKQLAYYLQCTSLTIFCGLTINIQVTTRLMASSCPAVYWICADHAEKSRFKKRLLALYFGTYFIIGTTLHANFYPWT